MTNFKRFLTLFFISTLTAVTMHVWGADKTVTWTGTATSNLGSTIAAVNGTATGTIATSNGSDTYNWSYTRTLVSGSDYMQMSSGYIQLGKNGGVENITFSTSNIPGTIKSVSVDCSSYNNAHKVSISVGGTTYLSSTATAKWTATSVKSGTGTSSGEIIISFTDGTRALYIKSISVTYNNDGGGSTYTVTLNKNGSTSDITGRTGTYTLPTTGEHVADACTGWAWHCWANAAYAESTTAPSSTVITTMSSAGTAYAVYKNSTGGGDVTFDVETIASNESWVNGTQYSSYTISPYTVEYSGGTNDGKYYSSDDSWRLYKNGTITITSASGDITSVETTPSLTFTISGNTATYTEPSSGSTRNITEIIVHSGTTTYTSTPSCGPQITISGQTWVTSTNGQTVKAILDVEASNFGSGTYTMTATSSNGNFDASLVSSSITSGSASTQLVVEYEPSATADGTEYTDLTITADNGASTSRTFRLNGRHLPAQFVMVTKNDDKWLAVPGDMPSGNTYAGIEVAVDDATTPTTVTAGPANALYSLSAVASSRYSDYGTRVRLLGKASSGCLWSNNANNGTGIKNGVTDGTGDQYEWTLTTTDGITYAINTNVALKISEGRDLVYRTGESKYGMYAGGNQSFRFLPVSCGTRATVSNVVVTHNSATFTWTGDSESTYKLIIKQGGTTVTTINPATSPTEVTGLAGNTTYTYILTPGTESAPCALEGTFTTAVAPITVTLHCDKTDYNLGEQTNPYTLPTSGIYTNDACDEWTFAGWYSGTYAENTTAPTYITQLSATGAAYAVYQHTEGGSGSSTTVTVTDLSSVGNTHAIGTQTVNGITIAGAQGGNGTATNVPKYYSADPSIRCYASNTITISGTDITQIDIKCYSTYYGGGVTCSAGSFDEDTPTEGYDQTWTGSSTSSVTFTVGASQWRISEIKVTAGSIGTTTYSTTSGCCTEVDQPEVTITPRSTSATISWKKQASATNGYQVVVALGTDTVHNASYIKSVSSCIVEGLTENTTYTYTVTAKGPSCNRSVKDEFKTTEGDISVAEWAPDAVYLDLGDMASATAVIENQDTQAAVKPKKADDLFFSKYFEGEGSMKLLAIYNGTGETKDLSEYTLVQKTRSNTNGAATDTTYTFSSLGSIANGQEIIFFTRDHDVTAVQNCANDFLDEKKKLNAPTDNPRWIECGGESDIKAIKFSGNDALLLFHSADTIDLFGSLEAPAGGNCRSEYSWGGTVRNMDYGKTSADFPVSVWSNLSDYGIDVSNQYLTDAFTARIIMFRDSSVVTGDSAVKKNKTTFATFTSSEWNGRNICSTATVSGKGTCNSFTDLTAFNYDAYYAKYDTIDGSYSLNDKRQPDGTYKIEITDLDKMSCTNIRITVKNNTTGKSVSEHWQVPIFVKNTGSAILTTNKVFTDEGDDCATCDVVVLKGATLQVATSGKNTVRNLEVYNDAKLYVPEGQTFNVNQLILRSKDDTVPRADIRGTLNQTVEKFGFEKRIKSTRWYKVALPYSCKIEDVTFRSGEKAHYGKDWVLRTYNGNRRANGTEGGNWDNYTGDYMLPGVGYNLAIDGDILDPGNTYAELHFPMTPNDGFAEEASIPVTVYAYGVGRDVTPNHKGWNIIGNPYMMDYKTGTKGSGLAPLTVGKLDVDGDHYVLTPNTLRYVVKLKDNSREYEQVAIGDGTKNIEPFLAYFVQINGATDNEELSINFTKGQQEGRSSIVRRAREEYEEEEDRHPVWCVINLTNGLNEQDETTFLISDDFTDNYEMMDDLFKMRGDKYTAYTKPVLASRNNAGEMAFNALPDASAEAGIPLNFFAATGGSYSIAWDDRFGREEIKAIQLFDKETNDWYDLMNEAYTFSTNRTENTDRFMVSVVVERKKTPQVATDLDNLSESERPRKVLINGNVYILRGKKVYDVTGKQLLNR